MVWVVSKAFPVCYDLIFHHGEMYFVALSQSVPFCEIYANTKNMLT